MFHLALDISTGHSGLDSEYYADMICLSFVIFEILQVLFVMIHCMLNIMLLPNAIYCTSDIYYVCKISQWIGHHSSLIKGLNYLKILSEMCLSKLVSETYLTEIRPNIWHLSIWNPWCQVLSCTFRHIQVMCTFPDVPPIYSTHWENSLILSA